MAQPSGSEVFSDGAEGASFWSQVADNVDYYFFCGPALDRVTAVR